MSIMSGIQVYPGPVGPFCVKCQEDDAEYSEDFGVQLFRLLDALDRCDELWHACAVGFIKSKSRHQEWRGESGQTWAVEL